MYMFITVLLFFIIIPVSVSKLWYHAAISQPYQILLSLNILHIMNSGKSVQILDKLRYEKEGQGSWNCRVGEKFYSGTELRATSRVNHFRQCSSNALPFRGLTWNVATLAVSADSLHPVAAVGKRLLAGQVENQAQQRQIAPLREGRWWAMAWWGGRVV